MNPLNNSLDSFSLYGLVGVGKGDLVHFLTLSSKREFAIIVIYDLVAPAFENTSQNKQHKGRFANSLKRIAIIEWGGDGETLFWVSWWC